MTAVFTFFFILINRHDSSHCQGNHVLLFICIKQHRFPCFTVERLSLCQPWDWVSGVPWLWECFWAALRGGRAAPGCVLCSLRRSLGSSTGSREGAAVEPQPWVPAHHRPAQGHCPQGLVALLSLWLPEALKESWTAQTWHRGVRMGPLPQPPKYHTAQLWQPPGLLLATLSGQHPSHPKTFHIPLAFPFVFFPIFDVSRLENWFTFTGFPEAQLFLSHMNSLTFGHIDNHKALPFLKLLWLQLNLRCGLHCSCYW